MIGRLKRLVVDVWSLAVLTYSEAAFAVRTHLRKFREPSPALELFSFDARLESLDVQFVDVSREQVRLLINQGRERNKVGGMNWCREEYIAYALARPVNKAMREQGVDVNVLRTMRFRRHELYANDNIDYLKLAAILWHSGLVSVDGSFARTNSFEYWGSWYPADVPWGLVEYLEALAPWLPKPPDRRMKKAA